jgi:hypothetical protein
MAYLNKFPEPPVRVLNTKFFDYKRNCNYEHKRIPSLNDSGSILNDRGKIK